MFYATAREQFLEFYNSNRNSCKHECQSIWENELKKAREIWSVAFLVVFNFPVWIAIKNVLLSFFSLISKLSRRWGDLDFAHAGKCLFLNPVLAFLLQYRGLSLDKSRNSMSLYLECIKCCNQTLKGCNNSIPPTIDFSKERNTSQIGYWSELKEVIIEPPRTLE